MMKKYLLIAIAFFSAAIVFSQNDSLILNNGDVIIGEIKNMERGVVTIETDYSDDDFKIEWDGIKEMHTITSFLINTSDGDRFNGAIESSGDKMVLITLDDGGTKEMAFLDIVYLKSVDDGFWNKMDAFIDVGFDMMKENNQMTFSTRSGIEYMAPVWSLGLTYNTNFTQRDDVADPSKRTDGGLAGKYFLPKSFYIPVSVTYLKSSELSLNSRWTPSAGVGYYIFRTNHLYWGVDAGAAYNAENYAQPDSTPNYYTHNSFEGFFGTDLNLYDIGDFSLSTTARAFPSFTESGRWRVDFNLDTKYDLPLEFYIKIGFSMNYDNQPVTEGSEMDYTLHTGVGWEWP